MVVKNYKSVVKKILDLNWDFLGEDDLQRLIILSAYSALEFADSLRLTLKTYPTNPLLKKMASEELETDNLSFSDYNQIGDHSKFLLYFVNKYRLTEKFPTTKKQGEEYLRRVIDLPPKVRIMSIVSREQELPGIFKRILTAKRWEANGLQEFKFYLERHIFLDSHKGGHADQLRDFKINYKVADFYKIRLNLYQFIPSLFPKKIIT